MKIIQTYQQGGRHKTNNQPCEDRTFSLSNNDVDVIALADGAGSSKYTHSAIGAECVTETISKFFCNNFDKFYDKENYEELKNVLKTVCQRALKKKVEELGLDDISRLSSTLLCVAKKDTRVIVCHIGDGVIGKLTSKETKVLSSPDNGEFAGTTYFITNPNAEEYIRIYKGVEQDALAYFLMSDGTAEYIYDKTNNSFLSGAKKMALMAQDASGQEKLKDTVNRFMVEKDSRSDDCSFICMSEPNVEEKFIISDLELKSTEQTLQRKKKSIEELPAKTPQILATIMKDNKTKKQSVKENKKVIFIVATVFILLVVAFSTVVIIHQKKQVAVSVTDTSTQTEESGETSQVDETGNTTVTTTSVQEDESEETSQLDEAGRQRIKDKKQQLFKMIH